MGLRNCCALSISGAADCALAGFASGVCSGIAVPVCGDAQCVVRWVGPGLVATLLSAVAFYYSFLPPVHSLVLKPGQIARFVVFVASSVLVGFIERRATEGD